MPKLMHASYVDTDDDDCDMEGEFSTHAVVRTGRSYEEDVANVMDQIMSPEARDIVDKWTFYENSDDSEEPTIQFMIWFDESQIDKLTGLDSV